MTEIELLKAQVKELERLISLKDQTIANLQYQQAQGVLGGINYQGSLQNVKNQQQDLNQQTADIASICRYSSNVTVVGGSG